MKPVVIGIAGGTGSGKTTVTTAIRKQIADKVTLITQDAYYKNYPDLSYEERCKINYDHPETFDTELLIKHIKSLKNTVPISMPVYDYENHLRTEEIEPKKPAPIIIIEGILIFESPHLRDLMDIRIFVDTDADIRILRRIERDINERGRSLNSVIQQYRTTVQPMHIEFVEPTKRYADIIIPEGGYNTIAIDMIVAKIKSIIQVKK
jgi:uridine kinase